MNSIKFVALIGLMLFIFSCNDDTDYNNPGNMDNNQPPAGEVWMENTSFVPQQRSVTTGTTVTWVNKDGTSHTVTSNDGLFDTDVKSGGTFSYKFDAAGTYNYFCSIHANMEGTIVVDDDSANNVGY